MKMTHQLMEMNNKNLREFGIVTGIIVVVLFGLLLPWLLDSTYPMWPWYMLAILAAIAVVVPMALKPVYKIWMRFGLIMGWINTRIILGIVFYVLFTPIALFLKLIGKDPMQRKLDINVKSYRIESKSSPREQMEKPF